MADVAADFSRPYRITDGTKFRLKDFNPADRAGVKDKERAQDALDRGLELLCELQDKLYAQNQYGLLLIFQAMDAAGKDSVIKHVMSGVNPQGCQVYSFKAPSAEELDHDFLWRTSRCTPERGRIGIFNRSYYEETLVVRVHRDLLDRQHLPPALVTENIWEQRFEDISAYERYLTRNGIVVRKFFLNVSQKEQRKRFLARLDEPEKNWKFAAADVTERQHWAEYMHAYESMIRATATADAPWYIVPADHKWVTRMVVAAAVVDTLQSLKLHYPRLDAAARKGLAEAREALESERTDAGESEDLQKDDRERFDD